MKKINIIQFSFEVVNFAELKPTCTHIFTREMIARVVQLSKKYTKREKEKKIGKIINEQEDFL